MGAFNDKLITFGHLKMKITKLISGILADIKFKERIGILIGLREVGEIVRNKW